MGPSLLGGEYAELGPLLVGQVVERQPAEAARIKALDIPGVYLSREYRRYYPAGEVTGQLIGFTNVDDQGQAGLELADDQSLTGIDGEKRVIQDRYGRIVQDIESIRPARPGRDLKARGVFDMVGSVEQRGG